MFFETPVRLARWLVSAMMEARSLTEQELRQLIFNEVIAGATMQQLND